MLICFFANAQTPVNVSQAQNLLRYLLVNKGSIKTDSAMANTDSSTRVPNTKWAKQNFAPITGGVYKLKSDSTGSDGYLRRGSLYPLADIRYPQILGSYANPAWITSLDWSKIASAPSFEQLANKGVANGYAPLNSSVKIDAAYLPSYVSDNIYNSDGTLTGQRFINLGTYSFEMADTPNYSVDFTVSPNPSGEGSIQLTTANYNGSAPFSSLQLSSNGIEMFKKNGNGQTNSKAMIKAEGFGFFHTDVIGHQVGIYWNMNNTSVAGDSLLIVRDELNNRGLSYELDFSANFTARSLIDKAYADAHYAPIGSGGSVAWTDITGKPTFATVSTSGAYSDLSGIPVNVSSFTNDAGYISSFTETDPTVPAYAKSLTAFSVIKTATDPLYLALAGGTITGQLFVNTSGANQITLNSAGSNFGFISNPSMDIWAIGYGTNRSALGTNIATFNASGLVGIGYDIDPTSGNKLAVNGNSYLNGIIAGATWQGNSITDTYIASASTWNAKQAALVSATNIKTINGLSVLGSGNLTIASANGASTLLSSLVTPTFNSGSSITNLYSDTTAANTLTQDGDMIDGNAVIAIAGEPTGTYSITMEFGGKLIAEFGPTGNTTNSSSTMSYNFYRTGTTTAICTTTYTSTLGSIIQTDVEYVTGLDFTISNILKITGVSTTGATNDLTLHTAFFRLNSLPLP